MTNVALIHIAMEIWCIIFNLLILVLIGSTFDLKEKFAKNLIWMIVAFVCVLVSDINAWSFRGVEGMLPGIAVRAANFFYFFAGDIGLLFAAGLITSLVNREENKALRLVNVGSTTSLMLAVFLLVGNLFGGYFYTIGEDNLYRRGVLHPFLMFLELLPVIFACIYTIKNIQYVNKIYRKLAGIILVVYPLSMIVQEFIYGIQLENAAATILIMAIFAAAYFVKHDLELKDKEELLHKKEEVIDLQTQNTIAMVSPHFLYNTLNTIYYLCEKNPKTAQKQINSLSDYLRGHMDSLKTTSPVPLEKELEQVEYYLNIEELRYGDKLYVDYDIEETDFSVPMLSVQLLVENAIKHGLHPKKEGGNILISTRKTDTHYEVIVKDDGVGFDPNVPKEDGRSHTGIFSIRERLRIISNGTLLINSEIGKGTESIIQIPINH